MTTFEQDTQVMSVCRQGHEGSMAVGRVQRQREQLRRFFQCPGERWW